MNGNDPRQAAGIALLGIVLAFVGALWFAPLFAEGEALREWWWGGLQVWALPTLIRIALFAAPLAILLLNEKQWDALWQQLTQWRATLTGWGERPFALLIGGLFLLWIFRSVSLPFGDSYFYASDLIPREALSLRGLLIRYDSIGATLFYSHGYRYAFKFFAMDPVTWYNVFGILCTLGFFAWAWAARSKARTFGTLAALVFLFSGNWSQVSFGAVEHYGQVWLASLAFAILAVEALRGREPLWKPCAAYAIGAFFHLIIGWLFPALLFVILARWKSESKDGRIVSIVAMVLPAFLTISIAYYFGFDLSFFSESNAAEGKLIPFLSAQHAYSGEQFQYTTFDPRHLMHIAMEAVLMGLPGVIAIAALTPLVPLREWLSNRALQFSLIFCLCAGAFNLLWNPDLGFWRDQDLFSIIGLGLCVLGAALMFALPEGTIPAGYRRRILVIAIVAGLCWRLPVVLYHSILDANYAEPALLSTTWPWDAWINRSP